MNNMEAGCTIKQEKSAIMDIGGINPIIAIILGLLLIGLVFRIIKGVLRLVLIIGIFAFLAYIVLNYAR